MLRLIAYAVLTSRICDGTEGEGSEQDLTFMQAGRSQILGQRRVQSTFPSSQARFPVGLCYSVKILNVIPEDSLAGYLVLWS